MGIFQRIEPINCQLWESPRESSVESFNVKNLSCDEKQDFASSVIHVERTPLVLRSQYAAVHMTSVLILALNIMCTVPFLLLYNLESTANQRWLFFQKNKAESLK